MREAETNSEAIEANELKKKINKIGKAVFFIAEELYKKGIIKRDIDMAAIKKDTDKIN